MWFITLVVRNLWYRKVRTLLTCLGLAVAICAVVTMIGVADRFEQAVLKLLETRSVDLVVSRTGAAQALGATISQSLCESIRQIPGVHTVEPTLVDMVSFEQANLIAVYIMGAQPNSSLFDQLRMIHGRKPAPTDDRPAILGTMLAQALNKAVGDKVLISGEEFNVVGIYEADNEFENGIAFVPLAVLQSILSRPNQVTSILVGVEGKGPEKDREVESVADKISQLKDEKGRPASIKVSTRQAHIKNNLNLRVVKAMSYSTSLIAVIIGIIGMLNTMMISVFERTREIGALRALGWPRARVVRMIMLESLILCVAGWAVGILGSLVLVWVLSALPNSSALILPSRVSFTVMGQALVLIFVAGLAGASYPAYFAANLLPTEAVRHE